MLRGRRDEQLRTALEMFASMGAEAFAGRAERELLATGEHVRKRGAETWDELTAREAQIARLGGEGLSNARDRHADVHQPAHRRLPSEPPDADPHVHLRKVFSKLGITSRNQLARALPESSTAGQVA